MKSASRRRRKKGCVKLLRRKSIQVRTKRLVKNPCFLFFDIQVVKEQVKRVISKINNMIIGSLKARIGYAKSGETKKMIQVIADKLSSAIDSSFKDLLFLCIFLLYQKGIIDEKVCIDAAQREIIRRYCEYFYNYKKGKEKLSTVKRMKEIIRNAHLPIPS